MSKQVVHLIIVRFDDENDVNVHVFATAEGAKRYVMEGVERDYINSKGSPAEFTHDEMLVMKKEASDALDTYGQWYAGDGLTYIYDTQEVEE